MQLGPHPGMKVVDVVDIHVRLDRQILVGRDDVHDLVPPSDHTAHREDGEPDDIAGIGAADFGAVEHVLCRQEARHHVQDLGLDLPQILGHVGHPAVLQLDDLQLDLADRLLCLGDVAHDLAGLALESRRSALQLQDPRSQGEALGKEIVLIGELALDQHQLLGLGGLLGPGSLDLFLELLDPLVSNRSP